MFTRLDDISRERTRLIIEEQAKDPASKIGIAYNAFLNTAAIESKGLAPFQPWLNQIKGISSKKDYATVAAKADRIGIGSPIGVYVGQDDKNPTATLQASTSRGSAFRTAIIISPRIPSWSIFAEYLAHLTRVLTLAASNPAARAKAISISRRALHAPTGRGPTAAMRPRL
jgi:putative endopeptidase